MLFLYSNGTFKPPPRSSLSNPSSEFLYLGLLADSHGIADGEAENSNNARVLASTQYQKLGSPELKPLSKHSFNLSYGSVGVGSSGNEGKAREKVFLLYKIMDGVATVLGSIVAQG
jgi:hypothetical protein